MEIGTEAAQFHFWEYLFRIFGIVFCSAVALNMKRRPLSVVCDLVMTVGSGHLLNKISWKCHQVTAEQLLLGQTVQSAGQAVRTVRYSKKFTLQGIYCRKTVPLHTPLCNFSFF